MVRNITNAGIGVQITYLLYDADRVGTDSCLPIAGHVPQAHRPRRSRACSPHPVGPDSVRWRPVA